MVEWKKLGDVCKVHTGDQLNRVDMLEDGPYPVVNGGKEYSGFTDKFNEKANTITISQGGESAGFVNWINVNFWAGAHCYVVEKNDNFNERYIYHALKNKQRDLQIAKQGAGIPGLNRDTLYKLIIPIPSIPEQNRIVGILDTFTSSIDNLKEQIALRRKQYEYYRNLVIKNALTSSRNVTLKDVAVIKNGKDYKNLGGGEIPVYGSGGIMTYVNKYVSNKHSVLLPRKGTVDNIFYVEEPFWTVDTIYWTDIDESKIIPKFLFYSLSIYNLKEFSYGGARPSLSQPILYKLNIPLPSLSEQQRIVSILDTFKASIQNLEAQLAEREKQYEYYRNKLLTFE